MQNSQAAPLFLRGLSEVELTAELWYCHVIASRYLKHHGEFSEISKPLRLEGSQEWVAEGVLATHGTNNHMSHSLGRHNLLTSLYVWVVTMSLYATFAISSEYGVFDGETLRMVGEMPLLVSLLKDTSNDQEQKSSYWHGQPRVVGMIGKLSKWSW